MSILMKKSKKAYYYKYFVTNWNNIKNISKGIKIRYFSKNCRPIVLSLNNNDTITNPYDIADTFNNDFEL